MTDVCEYSVSSHRHYERIKSAAAVFVALLHELGGTDPKFERMATRELLNAHKAIEDAVAYARGHVARNVALNVTR